MLDAQSNHSRLEGAPEREARSQLMISEWRNSWRPGLAALVGGSVCFALYNTVASLFIVPLQEKFGWSRGQISLAYSFGILSAVLAPFLGRLVDAFGPRRVILIAIGVTSACYAAFATMNGDIRIYYLTYMVFSVFGLLLTALTFTRIIVAEFTLTRGTALAFSRLGLAVCAAVVPIVLHPIMDHQGASGGFVFLALLQLFVALPLAMLWLRPGANTRPRVRTNENTEGMVQLLLANPKIALVAAAALLNYAPVVTISSQLQPLAVSKGLAQDNAVVLVSLLGASAGVGALISGYLVDRFWAPAVAFTLNLFPAVGCLLLLGGWAPTETIYLFVILLGIGQGVEVDVVAFLIVRYFGLARYSTIYGMVVLLISIGSAAGASGVGTLYDMYSTYDGAIMLCSASFFISALLYLAMGRYPDSVEGASHSR